jgi:C1A family cysteine protease
MGVNQFTAWADSELDQILFTSITPTVSNIETAIEAKNNNVGINIDWVAYGAVSPVKDQGICVASYAFSAIGAIEGISVIFFKTTMEYSVQQIIDCTSSYGNLGCNSGTMVNSFNFIAAKGIIYFR